MTIVNVAIPAIMKDFRTDIAAVGAIVFIYESTDPRAKRSIDYPGVLTVSVAMFALTFAVVEGQNYGWTSPGILGLLALSALGLVAFALLERR